MNRCSGCGYIVPASWTECRKCGTRFAAAPVPVAAAIGFAGAPDDALIAGARPRAVVPDTMLPRDDPLVGRAPVQPPSRFNAKNIGVAAIAAVIVIAGVYSAIPLGGHAKQPPTVLAPRSPAAGIPTTLSDVVRIAAESARHTALTTVVAAAGATGAPLTLEQLASEQPNYQWIAGAEPSTTNTVISLTSGTGIDVIAVSGTDRDICAFGRWSPAIGTEYVTMAHVDNCSATNAPTNGWSSQPGGRAQDLPGPDGF